MLYFLFQWLKWLKFAPTTNIKTEEIFFIIIKTFR